MHVRIFVLGLILFCYLFSFNRLPQPYTIKHRVIIIPLHKVDSTILIRLKQRIETSSNIILDITPESTPPSNSVNHVRKRYIADSLLKFLSGMKPPDAEKVIGITNYDIESTVGKSKNWGVMGLSYQPGSSCVVSTFRPSRNVSAKKLLDRIVILTLHELGHSFSLDHCLDEECIMQSAKGGMRLDFSRGYCRACLEVLSHYSLQFYAHDESGYSQHTENK